MRAIGLLCAALLVSATAAAQIDPRTALLERAGWDAIAAGRAQDAASAFRQAIAGDPRNPRLYLGAGTAAFLDRRDADATGALERALELNPNLTQARTLLGQVLYRTGDLAGAIRVYDALIVQAPGDAQVRATLDKWRREAELNDRLERTLDAHFTVSFEGPEQAALAAEALAALDRAYWRIGAVLATYPVSPINVVLYTSEQFRDITRSPSWAVGAYDGTIRVPMRGALDDPKELDRVLAHEFTHALIRGIAPAGRAGVAERRAGNRARDRRPRMGGIARAQGARPGRDRLAADVVRADDGRSGAARVCVERARRAAARR